MPTPQGFPPLLWAVTFGGILIIFLILRKMSSLKGVVAHGCVAFILIYTTESLIYSHYCYTHVTPPPFASWSPFRPRKFPTLLSPNIRRSRLKTVTSTKQGAIRLPDDGPDSTAPRSAHLDVPSMPARRFSISEDPESDTTSSDVGSVDARNSYESDRHFPPPLPRSEFAGRVPKPKPKNQGK